MLRRFTTAHLSRLVKVYMHLCRPGALYLLLSGIAALGMPALGVANALDAFDPAHFRVHERRELGGRAQALELNLSGHALLLPEQSRTYAFTLF